MKSLILLAALVYTCTAFTREGIWMKMHGVETGAGENIPQLAVKLGEKTLVDLVKKAGLADTLSGPGPFTVFGPTDAAFAALPKDIVDMLMANKTLLKEVLLYHVLPNRVYSSQLSNELTVKTANGKPLRVNIYKHMSKTVVTAQGSPITLVDQNATNGVIHALSRVMLPPLGTVVDVVVGIPQFSTLKTAVLAANLQGTLSGPGPFTVFAPTNEAFAKLPAGTLDDLLKNPKKLMYVLKYHVTKTTYYSSGLFNKETLTTLNTKDLTVQIESNTVEIVTEGGKASGVVVADVSITNGVIHVIDNVLIPPDMALLY